MKFFFYFQGKKSLFSPKNSLFFIFEVPIYFNKIENKMKMKKITTSFLRIRPSISDYSGIADEHILNAGLIGRSYSCHGLLCPLHNSCIQILNNWPILFLFQHINHISYEKKYDAFKNIKIRMHNSVSLLYRKLVSKSKINLI